MVDSFGTFRTARREPAVALQPLVDPAGWEPDEIARSRDWAYRLSGTDCDELAGAIDAVARRGIEIVDMKAADFPLPRLSPVIADMRRELLDGRGFVYIRGIPVGDMTWEQSAIAYFGIGLHLGRPLSQNAAGHLLGHVKDYGGRLMDPHTRGYQTSAELGFHSDHSAFVGLLCLRTAKEGGASRIASSVTLYNRLLATHPDLVQVLSQDFYWSRHGEVPPGKEPWYTQPAFAFKNGYFSARGVGNDIRKTQGMPGVPPFTPLQIEAMALFQKTTRECAVDLDFEQGDIQFLHNNVVLHARTAYVDWPEPERRRHLMRLWLSDDDTGRPLTESFRENFQGIRVEGYKPQVPFDVPVGA